MNFKTHIQEVIATAVNIDPGQIVLEHPEKAEFGDYSTNIALILKGGRPLAEEIAAKIKPDEIIKKVDVAGGGFLNIWLQTECLIRELDRVLSEGQTYGAGQKKKKTVVVDYSAPNIAKPFGIGHLRSTIIGQALYNILKFQGYTVVGDNHLGDWGTQFGKLLYMIELKKDSELSIEKLEQWYVEFYTLAADKPELEDAGRAWFKRLEDGDEVARALWQRCVDISLDEYKTIYDLLGVSIDYHYGESFYEAHMAGVIADAKRLGVAHESQGAWVVDVTGSETPLMLVKSDGATTYATRDLATIKFRQQTWNPDMIVYEVGNEQAFHFQQVFDVARQLGYVVQGVELVHTRHGLYLAPDGKKFSTRKGKTVKLEEVLYEAIDRAKALGDMTNDIATKVGVGAIKYFDLSHNIQSDIVFDWNTIMALVGNSGPYVQYAYARTQSILEKKENKTLPIDSFKDYKLNLEEESLVKTLYKFSEVIELTASRLHPHLLCNFLFELAQRFNAFYASSSVLSAEIQQQRDFRILLTGAVAQVLENGLKLLGIEAVARM